MDGSFELGGNAGRPRRAVPRMWLQGGLHGSMTIEARIAAAPSRSAADVLG